MVNKTLNRIIQPKRVFVITGNAFVWDVIMTIDDCFIEKF